jgi:HAD superfamily hydrolase (TIGR01509 family)
MLKALIFDVDGTLADTESAHRAAFNKAFAEVGRDWVWDEPTYVNLLEVSGGKERILHYWQQAQPDLKALDGMVVQDMVARMLELKTAAYERAVQEGSVLLRPGVLRLIEAAHQGGLQLAIATTTSPVNISALLRTAIGPDWAQYFVVVEDASTAPIKKPHPQVYMQTLARLNVRAADCVAFEDSGNGLKAALAAGLPTIITPNSFTEHHNFTGALRVLPSLLDVTVARLREWHGR